MPNVPHFYYFGEKGLRDTEEKNLCYVSKSCKES